MNLTPLYDLRERLRSCVIAGAALAGDDFRLKRALEAFAPFEKAAPVFARLGQQVRLVLSPGCPDRAGALLDAISLADAVLCTQAAGPVPGEPEPVEAMSGGTVLTNAPYSVLNPILDALTSSGAGKYSFVSDTHRDRPEIFRDYRVQEAMVKALGAGYAELADRVQDWLIEQGEGVIPLVKAGFDPQGKKDMVRRVKILDALRGAEENDFYYARLETAEKDVRAQLIYALRHDTANAEKLVEMTKAEKGKSKKMALCALASMDCPAAEEFWTGTKKNRDLAMQYMGLADSPAMSRILAEAIGNWLAPYEADHDAPASEKAVMDFEILMSGVPGKSGPEICDVFRRIADLSPVLDRKVWRNSRERKISELAAEALRRAIICRPTEDLLNLAEELRNSVNAFFAETGITAALLRLPPEKAYDLCAMYLRIPPRLFGESKARILGFALDGLFWEDGKTVFLGRYFNPLSESVEIRQTIEGGLDPRWFRGLAALDPTGTLDSRLYALTPKDDPELREFVGNYLYHQGLKGVGLDYNLLASLKALGWQKCEGLGERFCRKAENGNLPYWNALGFLRQLPGPPQEVQAEWEKVVDMVRKGTVTFRMPNSPGRGNNAAEKLREDLYAAHMY